MGRKRTVRISRPKTLTVGLIYVPGLFMADASEMTERFARHLAELADLCLVSARDLVAAQVAATDPAEKAACAGALHKVGRSLRQCMALEAKLRRDQEQGLRDAQIHAAQAGQQRRRHRYAQVKNAVTWLIYDEHEDDAIRLTEWLDDLLDEDILAETFGDMPLETHIACMCARLGLARPAPDAGPRGASPQDAYIRPPPPIDEDSWRSSA